jgi:hypothetical protein
MRWRSAPIATASTRRRRCAIEVATPGATDRGQFDPSLDEHPATFSLTFKQT